MRYCATPSILPDDDTVEPPARFTVKPRHGSSAALRLDARAARAGLVAAAIAPLPRTALADGRRLIFLLGFRRRADEGDHHAHADISYARHARKEAMIMAHGLG